MRLMEISTSDKFIIKGLGGKKTLNGKIRVSGAKNAALKLMTASILFNDTVTFSNIPEIEDVSRMSDLLKSSGAFVKNNGKGVYEIDPSEIKNGELDYEISKKLRASIVLTGPTLARLGKVSFPHPGGCVIGARPIDIFLEGFEKMGARVTTIKKNDKESFVLRARGGKLKGAEIFFKQQSVTATETFMMAGVLATGKTVLKNAALEPEIKHLADFLSMGGAKIKGAGTTTIEIEGVSLLQTKGRSFKVMPDRIETGSFLILAALAGRDIEILNCEPSNVESLIQLLELSGVKIKIGKTNIIIKGSGVKNKDLKSVSIKTHEYPGFPTDLQAPMVVYLTQVKGESLVFETIFEGRLNYTESLTRMGATIEIWDPHRIMVKGPVSLKGRVLESPDLRAGLAFVIAAIVAKGESVVHNVYNIDRGYERIEERLKEIGVDIIRVKN